MKQRRVPALMPVRRKRRRQPLRLADVIRLRLRGRSYPRQVAVIINPAAGGDRPILKTINKVFQEAQVGWEAFITHQPGDARRLAEGAAKAGVDAVVVYGGDGTVSEAASGLVGTGVPLGVLPGGTSNIMSAAFGIPRDLTAACRLVASRDAPIHVMDIVRIGERYFLQMAGIGLEAKLIEGASRELKDRFGMLAYGLAALAALGDPPLAHYHLELDGQMAEVQGVSCLVANGSNLGITALGTSDGLLDVFVLRKVDLISIISAARIVLSGENSQAVPHFRARRVTVQADPPQTVQVDGDVVGMTPVNIELVPRAVRIIVPRMAEGRGLTMEADAHPAGS